MSCTGNSLLCVMVVTVVCRSEIYLLSVKLRAACDKGESLRYVHWKILHSRWTVILQLEWRVLK
jgi:hypothetical protein